MAAPTQADIDRLEAAYYSGSLIVRHGETSTTYRSRAEMKAILDEMKAALNGTGARRTVARYSSGL